MAQGLGWTLTAAFAAKLNRTSAAAAKFLQGIAADVLTYRQFSDMKKGEPGRTLLIAAADWEKAMGNTKSLDRKMGRASSRLGNKAAGGGDPLRHV